MDFFLMSVIIIMGSEKDKTFVERITNKLEEYSIEVNSYVSSAHKNTMGVLGILDGLKPPNKYVIVTVAGMSNALSGVVAANTSFPVIACPPFKDNVDMLVNIHSTLQMPSKIPVLTILNPENCALAIKNMIHLF